MHTHTSVFLDTYTLYIMFLFGGRERGRGYGGGGVMLMDCQDLLSHTTRIKKIITLSSARTTGYIPV